METWELEAREQIRDIVARYNASGDSGRLDEMLALFCDDAVMEIEDARYQGPDAIRGIFEGAAETTREGIGARLIRHHTATHQIDVLGPAEARGRCYFLVLTDRGLDHWGRYVDEYSRVGERWLFRRRRVRVDGRVEGGWAAQNRARRRQSD